MKYFGLILRTRLLSFCLLAGLGSCNQQDSGSTGMTVDEAAPVTELATEESPASSACQLMVDSMLAVAEQAVNEPTSRPERRAARQTLLNDWQARLAAGEDPCVVYESIAAAVNNF